jgi:two-component system, OmpR family, copper resistance phosphate regulon response regulator CusR
MRLLYTADGSDASERLISSLGAHGVLVDRAQDGTDVLHCRDLSRYDLIILDVGQAGVGGSLFREIRRQWRTPVLMLTARGGVDLGPCGDLGADDRLARPFDFPELLARVGAIVHRREDSDSDILRMADLEVHLIRRRVERAGRRIDLTARQYALLLLLLTRGGEVVSRADIADQIREADGKANIGSVERVVRRLRRQIDAPFAHKLIRTVRGAGYSLEEQEP